jgi:serine/threonine protein kinase
MARQVIERDKLGVLTKIAQGGQGVVYQAPNVKVKFASSMVYKEYKPHTRAEIDFTALAAMPALVEDSLSYAQAERLVSTAAWPCAMVEDKGTATGFVMPAIPQEFFIALTTVKGSSTAAAEFQHLLNHPSVLAARGINIDDAQRYTLLREAASGLEFLHKHGVSVGDISPKNLLFSLTPHPAIYFIDCDAMRINGVSALRQVETPGWEVPAGEELATAYSDTYKLGLLALRLLVGDHDTTNPQHLPATTPDLLRQVITDTLTNPPQRRPLPDAWNYVLGNAIETAQHRLKIAGPTPVSTAPAAPPTPQVRSRPSTPTPQSAPPPPPPTPQVRSRPSTSTPQSPPGTEAPPVSERALINEGVPDVSERLPELAPPPPARKRSTTITLLIAAIVVIVAAAGGTTGYFLKHNGSGHTVLPFDRLNGPEGVAVDTAGDVYVVETYNNRVLKLPVGSTNPIVLPFIGLNYPYGVAVDTAGNLYVTDPNNERVLKLVTGASSPVVLPLSGRYTGIAVDSANNLYVTSPNQVVKLAAGSGTETVLPFSGLDHPGGVAVDTAGDVYVTGEYSKSRVLKLAAGSSTQTELPLSGGNRCYVAADAAGDIYVTDFGGNRVVKLLAGSATQTVVPYNRRVGFENSINEPTGVAVDGSGNLYVVDWGNHRVLKVPSA